MIRLSSVRSYAIDTFARREKLWGRVRERKGLMSSGQLQYSPRYRRGSPSTIQDVSFRTYQLSVSSNISPYVTLKLMNSIVVSFHKHWIGGVS
jgi:hypothetical protein